MFPDEEDTHNILQELKNELEEQQSFNVRDQ